MNVGSGVRAGDPTVGPVDRRGSTVEGCGQFQDHEGSSGPAMNEVWLELGLDLGGSLSDRDVQACRRQRGDTPTHHARIGIFDADDDATYSGSHDRIGARRRSSMVDAWLQRHRQRGTDCALAGLGQRHDLGVGSTRWAGGTVEGGTIGCGDDGADPRIR